MSSVLITNATVLTMNDACDVVAGDVSVRDGRIASVGGEPSGPHDTLIDAGGGYLLPGFVQTHIHLCQTLFRGYADDLRLLDWLRTRVWPMEAAHTPRSLRAAARLACSELLHSGTTSILTMETVHDTDAVFEAVTEMGIRATIGKCMMDAPVPPARRRACRRARSARSMRASIFGGAGMARRTDGSAPRLRRASSCPALARCSSRSRRCQSANPHSFTRMPPSSGTKSISCAGRREPETSTTSGGSAC